LLVGPATALHRNSQWSLPGSANLVVGFWSIFRYLSYSARASRAWFKALLFQTVTLITVQLLILAIIAFTNAIHVGALLLLLDLATALALVRLANIPEQTLSLQRAEEFINAAPQDGLLIGSAMLTRRVLTPAAVAGTGG